MLILASSSTAGQSKSFTTLSSDSSINLHSSEKGPLAGINLDIFHLQELPIKGKKVFIKSSKAEGKLISRKDILKCLSENFPWYSGCGGQDGNL